MGQPIRWDNVNGPSLTEASRPMELARASFGDAFAGLRNTLQEREAIEATNWQTNKANNTNMFLDAVAKYRTPEELQAAQASGALDQLRAGFGNQIDAGAVRGAADARLLAVMQQKQQMLGYEHAMADERAHPFMQAYKVASLKGDQQAMAAADAAYQQAGGRDLAGLVSFADQRSQEMKLRGQADTKFGWEGQKVASDLKASEADIMYKQASAKAQAASAQAAIMNAGTNARQAATQERVANFNIETGMRDREAALAAGKVNAIRGALKEKGNIWSEGSYNGSQSTDLMEFMVKNHIGDNQEDRANIIKKFNQAIEKGVKVTSPNGQSMTLKELPLSYVKAAIVGAKDPLLNIGWNTGYANNAMDAFQDMMSAKSVTAGSDGKARLGNKAVDDLIEFKDMMKAAQESPVPAYPVRPSVKAGQR